MGGDKHVGGDGPTQNLRWGTAPCICPPIFGEVVRVMRCAGNVRSDLKRWDEDYFWRNRSFSWRKGLFMVYIKKVTRNFWR